MTDFKHGVWYPIETAPKDGISIIGYSPKFLDSSEHSSENIGFAVMLFEDRSNRWIINYADNSGGEYCPQATTICPTHWMLLPNPPEDL